MKRNIRCVFLKLILLCSIWYKTHDFGSFRNLKKATKDFIEKCLTLDPAYRPGAAHLLYTDYFSQDEFTKRKPLLQGNFGKFLNFSLHYLKYDKFRSKSKLLVQL